VFTAATQRRAIFHAADRLRCRRCQPFGNVVMEAMASGLPAMTSAFSGVAEVIRPRCAVPGRESDDVGEVALRLAPCSTPPRVSPPTRVTAENSLARYAKN